MARTGWRWTLRDLIDFEQALAASPSPTEAEKRALAAAIAGASGAAQKHSGWRIWLETRRQVAPLQTGRKFLNTLHAVTTGMAFLAITAGASTVLGLWDRARGGINVSLFLALILGIQWLVLLGALLAGILHRKTGEAFTVFQGWLAALARKFSGEKDAVWWRRLMEETQARKALLWLLARSVQTIGVSFNLGALGALAGLIMFHNVGFYWETTTEDTMRSGLERTVKILSTPWAAIDRASVPDAFTIGETRLTSTSPHHLPPGPREWWRFLLWSVVLWGMAPRWILRGACAWQERRALKAFEFESRHHRAAWRTWFGGDARSEILSGPADGALVIDVGGAGFSQDLLRPFLLRRLRVNPVAWERIGVLDASSEQSAREALSRAAAAIVLLAEGWALSPRQIEALLDRVAAVKENRRVILLIGNALPDGTMRDPSPEERRTWQNFHDGLAGSEIELIFHEEEGTKS